MLSFDDFCKQVFKQSLPDIESTLKELRGSYEDLIEIRSKRSGYSEREIIQPGRWLNDDSLGLRACSSTSFDLPVSHQNQSNEEMYDSD